MLGNPREIRRRFFPHHTTSVARINHGSFGSCPAPVQAEQAAFQRAWNAQPDEFAHEVLENALLQVLNATWSRTGQVSHLFGVTHTLIMI